MRVRVGLRPAPGRAAGGSLARARVDWGEVLSRGVSVLALVSLFAPALAGCGGVAGLLASVPDQPRGANRVGPATLIAEGTGAAGDYRAWIYRTADSLTCLEVAGKSGSGSGCGSGPDGASGVGVSSNDAGVFVSGGTRRPTAVSAIVHGGSSGDVTVPVTLPAEGVTSGVRYFVAGLPAGSQPTSVDIVDAAGAVLEKMALPST